MPSRLRSSLMVVLLGLALLLVGALALRAYRAEAYHQITAREILQDYADLGAEELAGRVVQQVDYYGASPLLSYLGQLVARDPDAPLPDPADLRSQPRLRQAAAMTVGVFALHLPGGSLTTGGPVPEAGRQWLRDTVPVDLAATGDGEWRFRTLFAPRAEDSTVVLYTATRGESGRGTIAFGVVTDVAHVAAAIADGVSRRPILPEALTRDAGDSATVQTVTGPGGRSVFRSSRQYDSTYRASAPVAKHLGGMTATVVIAPDMANALIIGGTPARRLPWLLALFLLGVAMIGAAMVLWRREQALARLRLDFVSGVSHELRTPLAQIRMFAETLRLGRVRSDSERTRSLAIIDQETRRLSHLVENLLHFSRGERRPSRLELQHCDLGILVADTVTNFTPLATSRGCEFDLTIARGVTVPADPDAVRQILLNLLDNAVKYGPEGQVIRVTAGVVDSLPEVSVEDHGPGIPEAQRPRVWQRFWRAERHRASALAGTGIGLSIVKELADLQGIEASVEAGGAGGARFVLRWPVAPSVGPTPGGTDAATAGDPATAPSSVETA